jgi:hypothetical protein
MATKTDQVMVVRAQDAKKQPSRAKRHARHKSGRADISLVGLLCGQPVFVPPPGVARVHRLDDESRTTDWPDAASDADRGMDRPI